jgi:hypothetical protein
MNMKAGHPGILRDAPSLFKRQTAYLDWQLYRTVLRGVAGHLILMGSKTTTRAEFMKSYTLPVKARQYKAAFDT